MRLSCALAVISVVVCSCGEASSTPRTDPVAESDDDGYTTDLDALRALGYVGWDEDVDLSLTGVTLHDVERSSPGYDLYTNDRNEAYLCTPFGERVHTWRLPRAKRMETFELLEDGGVLVLSVGRTFARLDRDSNALWRLRLPAHHDVRVLPDGSALVLAWEPVREYRGRRVRFDRIVHVSADGKPSDLWSSWENHDALARYHEPSRLDAPREEGEEEQTYDYYHMNCVERLHATELGQRDPRFREGNLLISLPNVNLIAVLDGETHEIVWAWGPGELDFVHTPTQLDDGNILMFDNGANRDYSRVLELDPVTEEIVWVYEGTPRESFYTRWRGSSQRLPNGNTLICDSERGRVFEVTHESEIVWEFWNPELVDGRRRRIYRYARHELDWERDEE